MIAQSISERELRERLNEWEGALKKAEMDAVALRGMISGVRTLLGVSAWKPNPRGHASVVELMREEPERVWKTRELQDELLKRGWAPSRKSVDAGLRACRDRGEVLKVKYGFHRLAPGLAASSAQAEASDVGNESETGAFFAQEKATDG